MPVSCIAKEAKEICASCVLNTFPNQATFHPHRQQPELIENPTPEKLAQTCEVQNEFYRKWFAEEQLKAFREIEDMVT